jgi:serine/threonine protein kinase
LTKAGGHPNIVAILRHGHLPHSILYYIDMELCDFNLEDYINGRFSIGLVQPTAVLDGNKITDLQQNEALLKQQNVWFAMMHISEGLLFLHERNFVHRDLKPKNGTS